MEFKEIQYKVIMWARSKNLLKKENSFKQFAKVVEEVGEIANELCRLKGSDKEGLKDAIGDTFVTLIILAKQNDLDALECLESAYNVIKDRTGKTQNGVFIKDSDLIGDDLGDHYNEDGVRQ
tara:strand:+ start:6741 stop:7106 length:366 start_codon:yes stop_codon:yes gene_type:complete